MSILPRRRLEMILEQVPIFKDPKSYLEQYCTPAGTAATLLHLAAYTFNDIMDHTVVDLGCGTGRLAIGAQLLGAAHVVGIDIDPTALRSAVSASLQIKTNQKIDWIQSDVEMLTLSKPAHTIIQNPPFGVQVPHQDQAFLQTALSIGQVIYTLHAAGKSAERYIARTAKRFSAEIDQMIPLSMEIPRQFTFHRKQNYRFRIQLYRIVRRK